MPVSLRPRHPADIAAEQAKARFRRPSITQSRGPNLTIVVLPAIFTAFAVYVGLVYFNKIVNRIADSHPPAAASEPPRHEQKALVREVDGVVDLPPVIETAPPPSPELVVEQFKRERTLRTDAAPASAPAAEKPTIPVLIPELEPAPQPLEKLNLQPVATPPLPPGETAPSHEQG